MPIGFLTEAERERLDSFPAQVVPGDIETEKRHDAVVKAILHGGPIRPTAANQSDIPSKSGNRRLLRFQDRKLILTKSFRVRASKLDACVSRRKSQKTQNNLIVVPDVLLALCVGASQDTAPSPRSYL